MAWEELTEEHYAIAEANGISRYNAWQRFNEYGWELEDAITRPVRSSGRRRKHNEDAIKIAEANGISRALYMRRIRDGWSEEKASSAPIVSHQEAGRRSGAKKSRFTEEQLETIKKNGINRATALKRVHDYGWSVEEAISLPALPTGGRREHIENSSNRPFWKSRF